MILEPNGSSYGTDGESQIACRQGKSDSSGRLRGARFLVVDDHPDLRYLVSCFIRKAGGEADGAENGDEAIKVLSGTRFHLYDAVILDMEMPVLNGYQTAARLRSLGIQIPVIALTASAMNGDVDRCLDSGCDFYLTKPIDRLLMIDVLASV